MSFSAWVLKENLGNWQRVFDFANGPENHNLLLANRGNTNEVNGSYGEAVIIVPLLFRTSGN